jgi:protein-S-isoprenylcysteine O-methyltransferase Ste14
MSLKGFDQLRKHVPEFNTPLGLLRILSLPVLMILLVSAVLNGENPALPGWQLASEALFFGLGFGLVYAFVRYKDTFKARDGPLAYRKAAGWLGYPGVAIIAAAAAHTGSMPGSGIAPAGWRYVLLALGWALIAAGALLALRAVQTFGVDSLVMLYVYFPEEGRLVNHKIYQVLRHPAYAAAQYLAFGLAFHDGNWSALACALLFAMCLWGWVRLVEEKELAVRFGHDYEEYRRSVNAFWPRPRDLGAFFAFLIAGR